MAAVSNTSPLLNLAIIDQLHLLRRQFGEIIVPPMVKVELCLNAEYPGNAQLREAFREGWVSVCNVTRPLASAPRLGRGETEALALAIELGVSVVLLDDHEARVEAAARGLPSRGIVRVLIDARRQGDVPSLRPLLDLLKQRARFFLTPEVVRAALEAAGESEG